MPNEQNKHICCVCKEPGAQTKFYKSYSEFYTDGYLPICKECFKRKFMYFVSEYHSNNMAMERMCMAFDIYFDEDLFNGCNTDSETVLGNYFRKLNMSQYKGKTFEDSINAGVRLYGKNNSVKGKQTTITNGRVNGETEDVANIDTADIEKWGEGLEPADYAALNAHYRLLSNANPHCDSNAEIFIIDLCYTKMQQMKAVRESRVDDYKKLTESYIKSFTQAGLKTVKDTNEIEDFTIGVTGETIEKYTPAEYYKNKSLYKDHDNLGDYVERFVLRPLRNLMRGTKDRDTEFFVRDEEETDGFIDEE